MQSTAAGYVSYLAELAKILHCRLFIFAEFTYFLVICLSQRCPVEIEQLVLRTTLCIDRIIRDRDGLSFR